MARNPYDTSEFMRAFDPQAMMRIWNPQAMMASFQQPQAQMLDMEAVIRANQRNFEAMAEANQAAANAYKDLLDKQMEIFEKLTDAARKQYEWAEETAGPDTMKVRTAAISEAVEEALKLMRRMAESARDANEEVYEGMQEQIHKAQSAVEENAKKAADTAKKS